MVQILYLTLPSNSAKNLSRLLFETNVTKVIPSSEKTLLSLPVIYLIMCFMKAQKNFKK